MKSLVVYYSFTSNNASLAVCLSKCINCERFRIETVKSRNGLSIFLDVFFHRKPLVKSIPVCLGNYDHVIFVAPIWAGKIATPLASFMIKEKQMIGQYSFISLCGGREGQWEKVEAELAEIMSKKPLAHVQLSVADVPTAFQDGKKKAMVRVVDSPGLHAWFDKQLREFMRMFAFAKSV